MRNFPRLDNPGLYTLGLIHNYKNTLTKIINPIDS